MIYSSLSPHKLAYSSSELKIKSKEINFYVLSELSALQEDHNESHFIFPQQIQKSSTQFNNGRWSQEEHLKFIEALFIYGNDWKKVQKYISTRTATQSRSHAQKFFIYFKKKFVDLYGDSKLIQKEEEDNEGLFEQILNVLIEMPNCENIARFCKGINDANNKSIENIKTVIIKQFSLSSKSLLPFLEERKKKFIKVIISLIQNSTITSKENKSSVYGMNTQNENVNTSNQNNESMNNVNELFKLNFDDFGGKTTKNEDNFELSFEDIPNFFSSNFL